MSTVAVRAAALEEPSCSRTLECGPEAASAARLLVFTALGAWDMEELRGDAAQIASELATNAVLHTGSRTFRFKAERRPGRVRISAEDSALGLLPARRAADDNALGGRGLHRVDALCARWGYELHPQSKTV